MIRDFKMKWSESEISKLKEILSNGGGWDDCLNEFPNRSLIALKNKTFKLKLKVTSKYIKQNKEFARKFLTEFTKESVYMLGLLWADGYVSKGDYKISLTNKIRDALDFLKTVFITGNWCTFYECNQEKNWSDTLKFFISNKFLVKNLNKLGYYPLSRESACKILAIIPENLKHYWFLGLIDGDGCFYFNDKHKLRQFQITGPIDQDWTFVENLFKILNIEYYIDRRIVNFNGKIKKRSNIRIFGRENIRNLGNYLYKTYRYDTIGLSRKYDKWLECIKVESNSRVIK